MNYETFFSGVLNDLLIFIAVLDRDGKIIFVNNTTLDLAGLNLEDVTGKYLYDTFWWSYSDLAKQKIKKDIENCITGELTIREIQAQLKGGKLKWIEFSMHPVIENGEVKYLIPEGRDITEQKKMVDEIRSRERFASNVLNSIGEGVISTNQDYSVTLMNPIAEKLTGFTFEEAKGKNINKVYKIYNEGLTNSIKNENNFQININLLSIANLPRAIILISKNGSRFIIEEIVTTLLSDNNEINGIVLTFKDITRQRKIEHKIIRSQNVESIGVLAGGIAHDFNNILTTILGNISLMKLDIDRNDEKYELLLNSEKAVSQACNLTKQLLTFSKGGSPTKKVLSIKNLINESSTFAISGSNCVFKFNIEPALWFVDVDKGQINQVINNIILNSIQSNPKNGIINIYAKNVIIEQDNNSLQLKPGKYVEISIEDTGCGIQKQHLEKIFDPYFTTKAKGTGLGLSICYSIIKKHGGTISMESEVGKGSKCTFYLVATEEINIPESNNSHKFIGNKKKQIRILVLEDNEMIISLIQNMLSRSVYYIEIVSDGLEIISLYKKALEEGKKFDIVLLDLTIPRGIGGKETMEKLLELDPDVNSIVTSGYSTNEIISNYQNYGFRGILKKPYSYNELINTINEVLEF